MEDIERDNLVAEKNLKQTSRIQHPLGPTYETRPQQFIASPQLPTQPAPIQYQAPLRQATQQYQYQYQKPQQYSAPQQYLVQNEKYYSQPTYQVQYVAPPQQQQSFYFLQPVTSPQTQMNSKVSGQKGPLQVIMLLDPNQAVLRNPHVQANLLKEDAHTHNLAGLLQKNAYTNHINQNFQIPQRQVPPVQPQGAPQASFGFQNPNLFYLQQPQTQYYMVPISSFYPQNFKQHRSFEQQTQQSLQNVAILPRRQPTSLLDSYIPSALQIQYLKQLQEAASQHVPQVVKYEGFDQEH